MLGKLRRSSLSAVLPSKGSVHGEREALRGTSSLLLRDRLTLTSADKVSTSASSQRALVSRFVHCVERKNNSTTMVVGGRTLIARSLVWPQRGLGRPLVGRGYWATLHFCMHVCVRERERLRDQSAGTSICEGGAKSTEKDVGSLVRERIGPCHLPLSNTVLLLLLLCLVAQLKRERERGKA